MPRRMTRAERERFLSGRHVAVLVTTDADGAPVPTPIWYLYRHRALHFRTAAGAVKVENVRRDPRVAVCVQDERPPYRSVTVYGTAEVLDGAPDGIDTEIPRHYLGFFAGLAYELVGRSRVERSRPDVTLIVRPQRFVTQDWTPETPPYGRPWLLLKRVLPPWL